MNCIVRIEALAALAALIQLRIPELQDRVCIGQPPPGHMEHVPNLAIEPTRWTYEPQQADEGITLPGNVVVCNVGDHYCSCVISIVANTPRDRARIEQRVLDLFTGSKHPRTGMPMPGVLVFAITACPTLGRWVCSFDLESDEWNNSLALDRLYESRIVVAAKIPALCIERPVYTINELILGVTHDMATAFTPATAIPPAVELVLINEDGSISPYEP